MKTTNLDLTTFKKLSNQQEALAKKSDAFVIENKITIDDIYAERDKMRKEKLHG